MFQMKHGRSFVFVWAAISYSAGPDIIMHVKVTARNYKLILSNQIHPMLQEFFLYAGAIYQDKKVPIQTAYVVQL